MAHFYSTLQEARHAARQYGFTSCIDFRSRRAECDKKLPSNPQKYYRDEWVDWFDFLGTPLPHERLYTDFKTAKEVAARAGFKNTRAYKLFCKDIDSRLPKTPDIFYKAHWQGWHHYLNLTKSDYYECYKQAQQSVQRHNIKTSLCYLATHKQLDARLPPNPIKFYANNWQSWYDFLGTQKKHYQLFETYELARIEAKQYKFVSSSDYAKRCKSCDPRFPLKPKQKYAAQWQNWSHFLSNTIYQGNCQQIDLEKLPFCQLKQQVQRLNCKTVNDYLLRRFEIAENIPALPSERYAEWQGWRDFLGDSYSPPPFI